MQRTKGFTLIELLVVIAIIGILAALAFPVFARAREAAWRGSDISHMNTLRTALQLYRTDQGGYPPALLGYATLYMTGPNAGNVVPADNLRAALYPRRVESVAVFKPAYERAAFDAITRAVWPPQDARAVGSAPLLDLDGDGDVDGNDDPAGARQKWGPSDGWVTRPAPQPYDPAQDIENAGPGGFWNAYFYKISGYDAATVRSSAGARVELRYALFWTDWGIGDPVNGIPGGNAMDDPRQLGYTDPPESTVMTWNSYYRDYDDNVLPQANRKDMVLFLGGAARPYDSRVVNERAWRVMP